MAQNTNPVFAQQPSMVLITVTGSYTDRTGATAGLYTLAAAGPSGSKVTQLGTKAMGTSITGSVLFFITDTAGNNPRIFDEILVVATTAAPGVASHRVYNAYADLQLDSGSLIKVAHTMHNSMSVAAQIGHF